MLIYTEHVVQWRYAYCIVVHTNEAKNPEDRQSERKWVRKRKKSRIEKYSEPK